MSTRRWPARIPEEDLGGWRGRYDLIGYPGVGNTYPVGSTEAAKEAAFLDALKAAPQDDVARLVFADWLEEHDDPRAEWVRDEILWEWMAPDGCDPILRLFDELCRLDFLAGEIDVDNDIRAATLALARTGTRGVPALIMALRSDVRCVRQGAADALGAMGETASGAIPAFDTLLQALMRGGGVSFGLPIDDDADFQRPTAEALVRIGPAALPTVLAHLRGPDERLRGVIAWALRASQSVADALPAFCAGLGSEDPYVRRGAVHSLQQLGAPALVPFPTLMHQLVGLLADPQTKVRDDVSGLLENLGAAAVPALIAALRDGPPALSAEAAGMFRTLDSGGPDVVAALMAALRENTDGGVRAEVVKSLGYFEVVDALPPLLAVLAGDENPTVRMAAAEGLGYFSRSADAVRPALEVARKDSDPEVREMAVAALRYLSS